ncbi:hypothetical protein KIL84_001448 [Mauremys mutica]|uniref:Uncharacterized protein n=1 Tax=Mauremys mutica TaxID=74926 RepID=A0A9D3X0U2_9SAUR|nr:hypothetical protein KIL84_001448 [Mauremys mutica]
MASAVRRQEQENTPQPWSALGKGACCISQRDPGVLCSRPAAHTAALPSVGQDEPVQTWGDEGSCQSEQGVLAAHTLPAWLGSPPGSVTFFSPMIVEVRQPAKPVRFPYPRAGAAQSESGTRWGELLNSSN